MILCGILSAERGNGIGIRPVAPVLEKCKDLGFHKILMLCDKDNAASAKTIIKNAAF